MHLPDTPLRRIAGSLIGWLAFSFFFTLLVNAALTVMMQNGGFCAVGGPYEIAEGHGCSELVAWSAPVSIFGGLAAVGLGVWLGRGFGVPLVAWAWTILFVGLGIAFVIAFVSTWDWGFGIPGALFLAMGAGPAVLLLRTPPRWMLFVGTVRADGSPFTPENRPGVRDVLLAWVSALVASVVGVALTQLVIRAA